MSIFEALMLICFGFAWPTSILKSIRSKSIEGKSITFLYIIMTGYLFGMLHKLLYNMDLVFTLYAINFTMVFIDLMLYYRNKRLAA